MQYLRVGDDPTWKTESKRKIKIFSLELSFSTNIKFENLRNRKFIINRRLFYVQIQGESHNATSNIGFFPNSEKALNST